jgi:hypothetical protein
VYVAPAGRDDNPGTLGKPFVTVQQAQRVAGPADTVLIRGGTYRMTEAQIAQTQGIFARVTVPDRLERMPHGRGERRARGHGQIVVASPHAVGGVAVRLPLPEPPPVLGV